MYKIYEFKGIKFDDALEKYDEDTNDWSSICQNCVNKHKNKIDKFILDEGGGGICGVEGCNNEADYYIDFPDAELKIIMREGTPE